MNERKQSERLPHSGLCECHGPVVRQSRRRRGFTLTELISTTAVMTLLLAITVPVVTRNREGERTAACLTNLKLLGQAISLYVADNQGSLPGPTTLRVLWNSGRFFMPLGPMYESAYRTQLTCYLAPYVARGGSDDTPADLIPFCPSADGIVAASSCSWGQCTKIKSYYLINTIGWTAPYATANQYPYYRTRYGSYFGYVYIPPGDLSVLPPDKLPRKLDTIPNLATEWALADIWYWEGTYFPRSLSGPLGTLPPDDGYHTTKSIASGQMSVPSYPFHGTTQSFSPTGMDRYANSPRITTGKTNAVYLDAHAASVRNWRGTVNPCFGASPGECN